jgi:hypothetical protein
MLNLDVIKTSIYDIIFGLLWLKKHDSRINFKKKIIKFENYECQSKPEIQEIFLKVITIFYKRDSNYVVLIMISMEKGLNKFKLLFKKYRRFKPLF